jgi:signal peptidase I
MTRRRWPWLALVAAVVAWARWHPGVVTVEGDSMEPALRSGRLLPIVRVRSGEIRIGMVVVAEPPSTPGLEVVKRVVAGPGDLAPSGDVLGPDQWFLMGDRPERSTDSRHFGPVPSSAIVARALGV